MHVERVNTSFSFQARVQKLDKEFDLVLLSERFEESMVLLAATLCWPLDYVKSFRINARKAAFKVCLYAQSNMHEK